MSASTDNFHRQFIEELHSHPACTDFIHDFLELISEDLLVVETRERVRLTSQMLYAKLFRMAKKMQENESYGAIPTTKGSDSNDTELEVEIGNDTELEVETDNACEVATSSICCPNLSTRATF